MNWVTRLEQQIVIRTGDGVEHRPQWLNAQQEQEFNFAIFNYIDRPLSQVQRNEPRSRRFPIEFYFLGENNIELGEAFRISALDRRPWTIFHPFYDQLIVHPIRLRFDNSQYNQTQVTGELVETIADNFPRQTADVVEQIALDKAELDENNAVGFSDQTSDLQGSDTNQIGNSIDQLETNTNTILEDPEDQVNFRNQVLNAQRDLLNISTEPIAALRSIQATINFPANVVRSVRVRVDNLIEAFTRVVTSIANLPDVPRNLKVYAETTGAAIISAMTLAVTTNRNPQTRAEVQGVIDDVLETYATYRTTLDGFETASQTAVDSYAANPDDQVALSNLVLLTLSALRDITLESEQEVIIVNEADSNAILLAHRVYGLDELDVNLNRFLDTNAIGLNEFLVIPKGREILYYV